MKHPSPAQYKHLIGKSKNKVIAELGQEFNFYHSDVWSYMVKRNFLGISTILLFIFRDEVVAEIRIRKKFGKI